MDKILSFADLPKHLGFPGLRRQGLYSIVLFVGQVRGPTSPGAKDSVPTIMFGWTFPVASAPKADKWYTNKVQFEKVVGEHECGVRRLSCYLSSGGVLSFAKAISNGCSLDEVSSALRIDSLPEELREVRLCGVASGERVFQPPIILRPSDVTSRLLNHLRPESSPVADAVAYCASTRLLKKRALLESLAPEATPEVERSLWVWIAKSLTDETGLDFTRNDAGCVGDFEVLDFPCSDVYGRSAIGWSCDVTREPAPSMANPSCHAVEIRIKRALASIFVEDLDAVFLECQLGTDNDIACDELRRATFDGDNIIERFESSTEICKVGFRVWVARGDSLALVFEDQKSVVRVVGSNIGIIGTAGRVQGGWSKHPKVGTKKIAEVESFTRVLYESVVLGGYEKIHGCPWPRRIAS